MQSYVISKQPGKAVFYLFTIMTLLVVQGTYGAGPIKIVRCYHKVSHGYLHVEGNTVETCGKGGDQISEPHQLYQISIGRNFTLYDPKAGKFICWNKMKTSGKRKSPLEARNYTKHLKISDCLFSDIPIPLPHFNETHVSLVHRKWRHQSLELKFNHKGTFVKKKCNKNNSRHRHRCIMQTAFLLSEVGPKHIRCPRAKEFCSTELIMMPELRECCKNFGVLSNETTN